MFSRSFSLITSSFKPHLRASPMLALRAMPTCTSFMRFSSQQLNDNEVIEYVEGKVFEVLK